MPLLGSSNLLFEKRYEILAGLIVVWAFVLRVWGTGNGLPILNIMDEGQLIPPAVRFGSGDLNPHSFNYPSFFKYLLFFLYGCYFAVGRIFGQFNSVNDFKLHYFDDPSDFYLIARIGSAVLGSLTVLVIYLIGKEAHSKKVGLVAALLFSTEFFHMRYSHLAKPDAAMVFLLMTGIYFSTRIATSGQLRYYLLAGAFGGLAISTKYNAVMITVAMTAAHCFSGRHQKFIENVKANLHYLVLGLAFVVLFFFVGSPYALLDHKTFLRDLQFLKMVVSRGDAGSNYLLTVSFYLKELFIPAGFRLTENHVGLVLLLGVIIAAFKRRRVDLVLLSFWVVHFVYFTSKASSSLLKPHYLLPIVPVTFVFGAAFLTDVIDKIKLANRTASLVLCSVCCLLLIPSVKDAYLFNFELSRTNMSEMARNWVEENISPDSKILQVGRHDLALRENEESLIRNSKDKPKEVLQAKIQAVRKSKGKAYDLSYLNPGWNVTEEIVETMDDLPMGVELPAAESISLSYWQERAIEYVIVMAERQGRHNTFVEGVHESVAEFTLELESQARLIKDFVPEPPEKPGRWVKIYQLHSRKLTLEEADNMKKEL